MNFCAVIFDMDGVISDTQVIHSRIEAALLREHGIELTPEEITRRFSGSTSKEMFPIIFTEAKKEMPPLMDIVREKWRRIDSAIPKNVRAIPGTREFIESLGERGLSLAVASSSRRAFIDLVLRELKFEKYFQAIASGDEVKQGKPDPEIFLLAAQRLAVAPEQAIVIEDAVNGMVAARRAGMSCIGLVRFGRENDFPADFIVRDLREVPLEKFFPTTKKPG